MLRRRIGPLLALVLVTIVLVPLPGSIPPAEAVVFEPYDVRFQTTAPGDITLVSNTLLTCQPSNACTTAQNSGGNYANNDFNMRRVDVDGVGATFTSSTSNMTLAATSSVVFAGLYWGAQTNRGSGGQSAPSPNDRDEVLFATPATGGYVPVTADQLFDGGASGAYQGFADVTGLVQTGGNGTYTVADVQSATGSNRFAGWSLVVVYEDATLPARNLTVFDGWGEISSGNPVSLTISGFLTPVTGTFGSTVGMVAYEGDQRYTGDSFFFEGQALSDPVRPANNFFRSRISDLGSLVTAKNPNYVDQLGFDSALVDASGILANGATSATLDFTTGGDRYFPGALTAAIDVFVPDLTTLLSKSFTDLNGGAVNPGDVLEFVITSENIGLDPAIDTVISDPLPAGVTYLPGTLEIIDDPDPANIGGYTDAIGDDLAEYDAGPNAVVFRVGTGATATVGGRVVPGETVGVQFSVTVDAGTENLGISNVAAIDYVSETLGTPFSGLADPPTTFTVEPLADMEFVSKTDAVDPVLAGNTVSYDLTVMNNGPSPAEDVVITDTLPAGFSFNAGASDASCGLVGGLVECDLGTVAVGAVVTVTLGADVAPDLLPSTVTNNATVATSTPEAPGDANNSADETTTIETSADISVTKTDAPDPAIAGEAITYTITVSNDGPSTAADVAITDTLPSGVAVTAMTPSAGTCADGGALVTCDLGAIDPGGSVTVDITVTVDPGTPAGTTLTNTVTAATSTPDPDPGNNSASADTTIDREVSLDLTKTDTADPVVAGGLVSYSLTVTNSGPSDTTNVVITDTLPGGVTFDPTASTAGCAEIAAGVVECVVGDLAAGASASVGISAIVDPATTSGTITNSATATSTEDPTGTTATEDTAVERSADLAISKIDSVDPATAGSQVTYTLTITNEGPSDAANVVATDTLPAGLTFNSSADCTAAGQTVTCTLGDLAAGATTTADILVDIDAGTPNGTIVDNLVEVASDDPDPDLNNNAANELTQIERIVALEFTKSATPDPVVAGEALTYTLTVENLGPSDATNVVVNDPLPPEVDFDGVASSAGSCTEAGGVVDCDLGDMVPGDTVTITIDVTVDPSAADGTQLQNTATADADELADPLTTSENTSVTRQADLSVIKLDTPDPVIAGEEVIYTLQVTNAGPSDAGGTAALDALPAGFTVVSATPDQGTCTDSGGLVVCDLGTVAAGATVEVEIVVDVASSLADGITVANSAVVSSDEPDPDPNNNTTSEDTSIEREADLALTKTDAADPVAAGDSILYTLAATNNGSSDASGVTVTDDVPAGTTFNAAASSTSCTEAGGTVTCNLGDVVAGATASAVVAFLVGPGTADGTVILNTASVVAAELDPDPANNEASEDTTIAQEADLAVVKVDNPDPVTAGEEVTYTIDVTNNGPSVSEGATVTDDLDADLAFVSATVVTGGATCTHTGEATGGTVTCGPSDLPAGATAIIEIVATVIPSATGPILNSAIASADTADPTPSNNIGEASTEVLTLADVSMEKTASPDPVVAGEDVTFTLEVANSGPSDAASVVVTDVLDGALAFGSVAIAGPGTCSHSGEALGGTVTCDLGTLEPGASTTITIVATVDATSVVPVLVNTAEAASDTTDPDTNNNSSTTTIDVDAEADLAIAKTTTPDPVNAGETTTSTLTVTNAGPSVAASVTVDDVLPAGIAFTSAATSTGDPCSHSGEPAGGTVSCPIGDLAVGNTVTITVEGMVLSSAAGTVTNTASVSSATTDPVTDNNTASSTVDVATSADLVFIAKTDAFDPAVAGLPLTYELAVRNDGPSDAQDVVISDPLPAGLTFDAATSDPGCSAAGQDVTCDLGTVTAGTTVTVVLGVVVDSDAPEGTLTNTATISSSTNDPDDTNNTASEETTIERQAQLEVVKSGSPDPVVAGEQLTYTVSVTNAGPSLATGVTVGDPIPLGTSFVSATPSDGGVCSETGGLVTCTLDDLALNATVTITIVVTVESFVADGVSLANTATADANESAPSSAPTSTGVIRLADLSLEKVDLADPVAAGANATWQLTVTNDGPSDAAGVVVADTLPPETTFDATNSTAGCTAAAGVVTCDVGTVAAGDTATVVVAALVDSAVPPTTVITNTATVASDETDPNPANNTASEDTTIEQINDLAIFKSDEFDPVVAGTTVTYLLTAQNNGPSNATGIVLTDVLPGGVTFSSGTAGCASAGGPIVICDVGGLAAGDSIDFVIVGNVDPSVPDGATITNSASIEGDGTDPDPNNNTVTESTEVEREPQLTIIKTGTPDPAVAGEQLTYTSELENLGPSTAGNVTLADPLPAGTTFVSVDTTVGSCGGGATVTCTFGDLLPGDTVTITIVVDVDPGLASGDQITNTIATRIDGVAAADYTEITSVVREADLAIEKSTDPNPATAGAEATYTLTVTNNGPSDASGVVVTDTLPTGVVVTALDAGCTDLGGLISCDIGDLAAGATASVDITVLVDAAIESGTSLTNAATVAGNEPDPNPADNATSVDLDIVREADLALDKVDVSDPGIAGELVTYVVTVTNLGPSDASGVVVTDAAPAGTTFDALASTSACTEAAGVVTCDVGDVPAGEEVAVVISFLVDPALIVGDVITNTATVEGNEPDPDPDNNTATEDTEIDREADLSITKAASTTTATAGEPLTYTIVVTNNGPSDAADVVITDALPEGLSFVAATPPCTETAGVVTCDLGTVPAGETVTIELTTLVDPAVTGSLSNVASVETSSPDPDPDNNTTPVEETPVDVVTDLSILKSSAPTPFVPGEPITYTIVVTNAGPSTAVGAVVSDTIPAEVLDVTWTCEITAGAGACDPASGAGDIAATVDLDPDGSATFVAVGVADAATIGAVSNAATVEPGPGATDPDLTNNSSEDTSNALPTADVSVSKTASPSPYTPGQPMTFTITVDNAGPSAVTDTDVVDLLPEGVVNASWTCTASGSGSCAPESGSGDVTTGIELGAGETATISIETTAAATSTSPIENTAFVLLSEEIVDPTPDDLVSTVIVQPTAILPPVAVDDSAVTTPGTPVVIDILANDSDPGGALDPTSVSIVTQPSVGTVTVDPVTGALTYTPPPGFVGEVTLVYEVCNLQGACSTATVTILVEGTGELPRTGQDLDRIILFGFALLLLGAAFAALSRRRGPAASSP